MERFVGDSARRVRTDLHADLSRGTGNHRVFLQENADVLGVQDSLIQNDRSLRDFETIVDTPQHVSFGSDKNVLIRFQARPVDKKIGMNLYLPTVVILDSHI